MPATIKEISRARFNALCFSRAPLAPFFLEELAWYADADEQKIAFVGLERFDSEYAFIILGRDEIGRFRWIEGGDSFPTKEAAQHGLFAKMNSLNGEMFPQGDVTTKKNEIYKLEVTAHQLHPNYEKLVNLPGYTPAKEIIKEAVYAYIDVDGNYIQQFQSTGFNARLWELYLSIVFYEMNYKICRDYNAPDYMLEYNTNEYMFVEAVTVNPTQNPKDPQPAPPKSALEVKELTAGFLPIKYGSALYTKLNHKYWELPHVVGKPLIFAIADFHEERSMMYSRTALLEYLYGMRADWHYDDSGTLVITPVPIEFHEYGAKKIPSGFFNLPGAENISAVFFNNIATLSKFNRMGKLAEFGIDDIKMVVRGTCHNHDPNASQPHTFAFDLDTGEWDEMWVDGFTVYHNPNALHPLAFDIFPDEVAHFYLKDGMITSQLPDFYPYVTETFIVASKLDGQSENNAL